MLANDKPVLNGLVFADDVPNNEDEARAGLVFGNKDGELLAGNAEPPVCPNSVVLVDNVNGLALAADGLLNAKPVEAKVGLVANGLFVAADGNWFKVVWPNAPVRGFGCVDDGKIGVAATVPEGFGPPLSPRW